MPFGVDPVVVALVGGIEGQPDQEAGQGRGQQAQDDHIGQDRPKVPAAAAQARVPESLPSGEQCESAEAEQAEAQDDGVLAHGRRSERASPAVLNPPKPWGNGPLSYSAAWREMPILGASWPAA